MDWIFSTQESGQFDFLSF